MRRRVEGGAVGGRGVCVGVPTRARAVVPRRRRVPHGAGLHQAVGWAVGGPCRRRAAPRVTPARPTGGSGGGGYPAEAAVKAGIKDVLPAHLVVPHVPALLGSHLRRGGGEACLVACRRRQRVETLFRQHRHGHAVLAAEAAPEGAAATAEEAALDASWGGDVQNEGGVSYGFLVRDASPPVRGSPLACLRALTRSGVLCRSNVCCSPLKLSGCCGPSPRRLPLSLTSSSTAK